ncbi:MAG: hypothetical protein HY294_06610 [Candidatus Rokubacteria bacterium]|nr:hypothetical protein [Candidatus Rokubacteria bacterium]
MARKQLRSSTTNWEAIRDLKVQEARLEAEVDLRRLEEERGVLDDRKGATERELARMGEPEASVRAHEVLARRWGALTLLAAGIAVASAWWTANWFLSLGWEKALLAVTVFVLPLIGWAALLTFAGDALREWDLRKIFAGMGLAVVLCSAAAVASLGWARMLGVGLQEEQRQVQQYEIDHETVNVGGEVRRARIESTKRLVNGFAAVAVVLLALAGEVAAGLAYHEYARHRTVVRTVGPFYERRAGLMGALAQNAAEQEAVRKRPEILYAQLTVHGLQAEAAQVQAVEAEERRIRSLSPTMRWVAAGFAVLIGLLIGAALAFGETAKPGITVVVLDLSDSVNAEEFTENLRAVEGAIRQLPSGGAELRVLAVDDASFGRAPLFRALSPAEAGRFGEYLDDWRSAALRAWKKRAANLKPLARGSDVIGAVSRAAIEFEEAPGATRRLLILSDMRQVGRGLNFEKPMGDSKQILERVKREGMIPELRSVEVWALGVDTRGIEESHWRRLKVFWSEFFKGAGADLKAFSPNRRLPER